MFIVVMDPTAKWERSTHPAPMITVDHDASGRPYRIVAKGDAAKLLGCALADVLAHLTAAHPRTVAQIIETLVQPEGLPLAVYANSRAPRRRKRAKR